MACIFLQESNKNSCIQTFLLSTLSYSFCFLCYNSTKSYVLLLITPISKKFEQNTVWMLPLSLNMFNLHIDFRLIHDLKTFLLKVYTFTMTKYVCWISTLFRFYERIGCGYIWGFVHEIYHMYVHILFDWRHKRQLKKTCPIKKVLTTSFILLK